VVAEADEEGSAIFHSPHVSDIIHTIRLDGAMLLSDRVQLGVSLSLAQHNVANGEISDHAVGLGDTRISLAYELLPLWTYSAWKPQGFTFLILTLPTGRSVYEAQSTTASDVLGNGFYAASTGVIFIKQWGTWDAFLMPELHYSIPRTFSNPHYSFQVHPGFGGSVAMGGGLSPSGTNSRLGLRIQPRSDQSRSIPEMTSDLKDIATTFTCDVALDLSYRLGSTDTIMVSYVDQTLLGPAANSNLNRTLGVSFQHRWER
jgi:hypothetical protein